MVTEQVQLKISLSQKLNDFVESKAKRLGIPTTQFVKHLIIKEIEDEAYPVFEASESTIKRAKEALKNKDKAVVVNNIHDYFKNL